MSWRYDFDCRDCQQQKRISGEIYCVPIREGRHCISADDDYVVRCSEYQPKQWSLFDEVDDGAGLSF